MWIYYLKKEIAVLATSPGSVLEQSKGRRPARATCVRQGRARASAVPLQPLCPSPRVRGSPGSGQPTSSNLCQGICSILLVFINFYIRKFPNPQKSCRYRISECP